MIHYFGRAKLTTPEDERRDVWEAWAKTYIRELNHLKRDLRTFFSLLFIFSARFTLVRIEWV